MIEPSLPDLAMQRMELAGADVIVGNIQDGLATVRLLQFNKRLPMFVHTASLMDIFEGVTLSLIHISRCRRAI